MTVFRRIRYHLVIIIMINKEYYLLGLIIPVLLEANNDKVIAVCDNPPARPFFALL